MSRDLSSGRESLTVEALERIDRICVHFEEEWRSGRRPRIEELVGDVLATERTDLFAELLMIELEYRRSRGEKPAVDEYKQRFPDACEQIDGLLGKSSQSDLLDSSSPAPVEFSASMIHNLNRKLEDPDPLESLATLSTPGPNHPFRSTIDYATKTPRTKKVRTDHDIQSSGPSHPQPIPSGGRPQLSETVERAETAVNVQVPDALPKGDAGSKLGPLTVDSANATDGSPQRRDRYVHPRPHKEGGLGRIWLVRDENLNREVALKDIKPEHAGHPEALNRFTREAQITGQLEHPNIVPVHELSSHADGLPFYTMRFVRGQTLRDAIVAHHMRKREGKGMIRLKFRKSSIELSGDVDSTATQIGTRLGTPAYMSPEQARGDVDAITVRTDVYGLGAILFEILTGVPPHRETNVAETLKTILINDTPRARSFDPSVPDSLSAVAAKAMAKQPSERYENAGTLGDDIQRWLAGLPTSAHKESRAQLIGRWIVRRKALTQSVLVLISISSLAWAIVEHYRGRRSVSQAVVASSTKQSQTANLSQEQKKPKARDVNAPESSGANGGTQSTKQPIASSTSVAAKRLLPPSLLDPKNLGVVPNGSDQNTWVFRWSEVVGASAYELHVNDPATKKIMISTIVHEPHFSETPKRRLSPWNLKGWTWHVRVICDDQHSEWSSGSFDIAPESAETPELVSPTDQSVLPNDLSDDAWEFKWSAVSDATGYELHVIGPAETLPTVKTYLNRPSCRVFLEGYLNDKNLKGWKWKVRAVKGKETSAWSDAGSFDVGSQLD